MSFHTTPSGSFYIDNNCLIFKEVNHMHCVLIVSKHFEPCSSYLPLHKIKSLERKT